MRTMTVDAVREMPVGGPYTLVAVDWAARFDRTGAMPIRFVISYLLRETPDGPKIAAYVSHEDQEETMRAHGLL